MSSIYLEDEKYIETNKLENYRLFSGIEKSLKKLDEKIAKYYIMDNKSWNEVKPLMISKFETIISKCNTYINNSTNHIAQNFTIVKLLNYPELIKEYLKITKINNMILTILKLINNNDIDGFFSFIKIQRELFKSSNYLLKYKFETLFELTSGNEILEEQMERYLDITKSFVDYQNEYNSANISWDEYTMITNTPYEYDNLIGIKQKGGANFIYPLHHFMMGKGKSAIITPLLSINFSLLYDKEVIIIVPSHLVKQTILTIQLFTDIFTHKNNIKVYSESNIKYEFLMDKFSDSELRSNFVFLIDEFDTVVDPIKSNFNITQIKDMRCDNLIEFIKYIIENNTTHLDKIDLNKIDMKQMDLLNVELILKDIANITNKIKSNELKENINWGMSPEYCYAIPYMGKDKPMINSNFSSSVLIVYLTFYYYMIISQYNLTEYLFNYLAKNDYINELFNISEGENYSINLNYINNLLKTKSLEEKQFIWNTIFKYIFSELKLSKKQSNTSFIDIINLSNIFKVGYSGTINVLLPNDLEGEKFSADKIEKDFDENVNVQYAIYNSKIYYVKNFCIGKDYINNYDALIDIIGLFKNIPNEVIGQQIYEIFNKEHHERDVIFIDSNDNKKVILSNGLIENYDPYYSYIKPFIYYSQSHIVGIDIKQDNYPNMKGLSLVDVKSIYSDVAQAIFRLRKINMGHSMDFVLTNAIVDSEYNFICNNESQNIDLIKLNNIDPKCFYDLIKSNETKILSSKTNLLNYQTLKCLYRNMKYKIEPTENILLHEEKIKYYYLENIPKFPNISKNDSINEWYVNIMSGILDYTFILNNTELLKLFNTINKPETLIELVYGYDETSINTNVEMQMEQEKEKEKEKQKQKQLIVQVDLSSIIIDFFKIYTWLSTYDFDIDLFIKLYDKLTIKINDNLCFIPNILSEPEEYIYFIRKNNTQLVVVYIDKYDSFLLIPTYFMYLFIDKFYIYNTKFNIISRKNSLDQKIIKKRINELKNDTFIKVLTNMGDIRECTIDLLSDELKTLLLYLFVQDEFNHSHNKLTLYNLIKFKRSEYIMKMNHWLNSQITNEMKDLCVKPVDDLMIQTLSSYVLYQPNLFDQNSQNISLNNEESTDKYMKLYIKYKTKYNRLKKM